MAARAASMLGAAALVVAAILASAQSTTGGCMQTLIGMSPCHSHITGNETKPSKSCCSQLATVVSSKPECLCAALALGLGNVNKTRAHDLPDECGIPLSISSNCASAPTTAGQTPPKSSGAAGRIMDGMHSEKGDIPNGLCVHVSRYRCTSHGYCFCCFANDFCYDTMDNCKSDCKNPSSSQDIPVAMTSPPPLPAP